MKKILNRAEDFVPEMLDGLLKAHPDQLAYAEEVHAIVRADAPVQGKVALATGGGSGHLPVFLGYVGKGLLDGCAVGDVFSSPSSEQMLAVTRRINGGKGVVYIYGNYGGDVMNFDMAAEMAEMEDIPVKTVLVRDDVASAPSAEWERRRGVAGMVFAFKVAGALADRWTRSRPWPSGRSPTSAPWAWRSRPARCRARASPPSPSARARWRSAWASTASPA
jgi:dihydroxyacetone kinase-like protein